MAVLLVEKEVLQVDLNIVVVLSMMWLVELCLYQVICFVKKE